MEATKTKEYAPWFTLLINHFNTTAERLQLDEEAASEMRSMFIEKCREQYAAGNKSGIHWMKKKQLEKQSQPSSSMVAS